MEASELKALRSSMGLSQTAFAELVSMSQAQISRLESGRSKITTIREFFVKARVGVYKADENRKDGVSQ